MSQPDRIENPAQTFARSDTFLQAAESILKAHNGINNFYHEAVPVNNLLKLGTTIPQPALSICMTALLCVVLGNSFGRARAAQGDASKMLDRLSTDQWGYYLNHVLPSDTQILNKLNENKPMSRWMELAEEYKFGKIQVTNRAARSLVRASSRRDSQAVSRHARKLWEEYYGRP